MILRVACLALLVLPLHGETRRRVVAVEPFDARRILWIGAHPDDDTLIAPLLGQFCVEGSAQCSMLVATRGENGPCALPGGCGDLGSLREQEMRADAAMFHATLTQWTLPDVMTGFDTAWPHDDTVRALREVIDAENPTVILTFDPNHGSTCHPAHKVIGALAIEAAAPSHTPVFVVETRATPEGAGYRFANGLISSIGINARTTWHYLVDDAQVHASQFSSDSVDALNATPDEQRVVFVAPSTALAQAQYTEPCD